MESTITIKSTPKDVFLHLFNIVTFYLSIIGFTTLYIQYINAIFPDALNYYFNDISGSVRVASSILCISVPAYLLSGWLLAKDLKDAPEKRELKLRKWLLYFTLFVSAITIVIDLITFIYNFFSGELTVQFFLKILVVLLIAAAVFGYYIWDLKRTDLSLATPRKLAIILSVLTIISVSISFFLIGSPATQRSRRFDDQRVGDLQNIQGQITNYWTQKAALPENLGNLNDSISGFISPTDPETKATYEYSITGTSSFQLCATFKTVGPATGNGVRPAMYYSSDPYSQSWEHKAERTCFSRSIDPQLYKPQPITTIVK